MKAWLLSFPCTTTIAPKFHCLPLTSPIRRRRPSLSLLSSSDDHVLLSTTEHSDGSFLFRFGEASESAIINDVVSTSQDEIKENETELVETINYKVKTPKSIAKLGGSVQYEKISSSSNVEQVVEQNEKDENMISNNVAVLELIKEEKDLVNDVASIDSRVLIGDTFQEGHVGAIASNLDASVSSSCIIEVASSLSNLDGSVSSSRKIEVTSSSVKEDTSSDESKGVDDLLSSTAVEDDIVNEEDGVVVNDVEENKVDQVIAEFSAVNTELGVEKDVPADNVDVPVGIEEMESEKVADGNLPSPKFIEAIDEGGTQNGAAGMSKLHTIEPETTGEAIDDDGGMQNGDAGTSLLHAIEPETTREEAFIEELFLSSGATFLANPSKALTGREDAHFLSENWFGIADGVRHWSFEGTTNESYAHELIENCKKIVTDQERTLISEPVEVLSKAAEETQSNGSSTALIAYFDGQAISVANIGDSGFIIIRNGSIFKRSSPMMHEFNFPMHIERGDDLPELVQVYKTDLEESDIIITASDGLFDNVYDQEIASIASKLLQSGSEPQEMSELLAKRALEVGKTSLARSPFGDAAQAAGYAGYSGGKLDDVTVIVSLVKNRSSMSSSSL